MQKAILEPTKTGKGFRVNVKGRIYYATYHEVMMLTYGERKSVVFKDWQEIERAYKARKSQKKVMVLVTCGSHRRLRYRSRRRLRVRSS